MKVTKDNAVVGLKVVIDKDSEYIEQQREAVYGVIANSAAHFPAKSDNTWVQVNWIAENGKAILRNSYRIGYSNIFDLNVYQEESKEVIPEYVECVVAYGDCVKGTVYCTANEIEANSLTWQEILISCGNLGRYFIPSTKEAYLHFLEEKPEVLVFGKFKIGSIVVCTEVSVSGAVRKIGDIFKIDPNSHYDELYYKISSSTSIGNKDDWRQATEAEVKAFESGITNIKDMKVEENLVGRYLKALVNNPVSIRMAIGEYLLVTRFNNNATYNVTKVKDNHAGFGIEVFDLPKFEVMPIGFTPESEEFKVGDCVIIIANTSNSVNQVGDVGQITGEFDTVNFRVTVKDRPDFSNSTRITDMRLATSSEIYEAQKLEKDKFISQAVEKLEVPYPTRSYKNFKECYTKLPIVTSVKRSNIVPLKLEKQKSLINLPTI